MNRIVSPGIECLPNLRQKLTEGEQRVFEMFHRHLVPEWEIYIQPHLNGLRPDFVLLNPQIGIAVFEVKDWNLDAMSYYVDKFDSHNVLMAGRDGEVFSIQKNNPATKVEHYKRMIYELYCPRLREKAGFAVITAGVIFPFADRGRVLRLLAPFRKTQGEYSMYHPISGMSEVRSGNIAVVFPESRRKSSHFMSETVANDLRGWLVEPDFAIIQREPLKLDSNQQSLVTAWPESGYKRIKGPAGSGKSLVLAARAALRANHKKTVLIVTFNITLWHYLRDLVVRAIDRPSAMDYIEFTHFHLFCKELCWRAGMDGQYDALFERCTDREILLKKLMPALARRALETGEVEKYDTILVDEGQDYEPEWWNIIRKALKPDGEMLLVADATQDIYGTGKAWTEEAMRNMGFSGGRWAQLKTSYRLPPLAQDYARDFAQRFLPASQIDLPDVEQRNLEIEKCHLRWVQCPDTEGASVSLREILLLMRETGKNGLANADITFLTDNLEVGRDVTFEMEERGVAVVSTFEQSSQERRREKMAFYMGDARIKATTLQSFKGWEARLLVVYVSRFESDENKALIYAALTRLKRSPEGSWLTVVCTATELAEFGKTWPDHRERTHGVVLFHATAIV